MYVIETTDKSFDACVSDLTEAVARHQFGLLHVHDLGNTLRSKGESFAEECKVFEICNPQHASRVLGRDLRINMALPCRVSVYTDAGKTCIGMIKPEAMLRMLSEDADIAAVAAEVEAAMLRMIEEASQ